MGLSLTSPGRVAVQPRPPRSRQRASGNCSPLETRFPPRRFRKSSVPVAERAGRARATVAAKSFVPGALLLLRAQRGQSPSVARAGDPRGLSTAVIAAAGAPGLVRSALLGEVPGSCSSRAVPAG